MSFLGEASETFQITHTKFDPPQYEAADGQTLINTFLCFLLSIFTVMEGCSEQEFEICEEINSDSDVDVINVSFSEMELGMCVLIVFKKVSGSSRCT